MDVPDLAPHGEKLLCRVMNTACVGDHKIPSFSFKHLGLETHEIYLDIFVARSGPSPSRVMRSLSPRLRGTLSSSVVTSVVVTVTTTTKEETAPCSVQKPQPPCHTFVKQTKQNKSIHSTTKPSTYSTTTARPSNHDTYLGSAARSSCRIVH